MSVGMKMGRLILSPETEYFRRKRDFLKGSPKFPNGKRAFHLLWLLVPGLSACIRPCGNVRGTGHAHTMVVACRTGVIFLRFAGA